MERRTAGIPAWAERNLLFNLIYKTVRMLRDEGLRRTLFAAGYVVRRRRQMREIREGMRMTGEKRRRQQEAVFENPVKISLIVPLYNTPIGYLDDLVRSVKAQTYPNWQLCLADGSDGEGRECRERCLAYAKEDQRIVYRKLDGNLGISGNTNAAIALSDGDYIAMVDHDDLLAERALFEVVRVINETGADFLYSDEAVYGGKRRFFHTMHLKPDYSPYYLRCCNYICHLTVVKRSLLLAAGPYDGRFDGSQDYDFVLRATERAEKIVHIDEPLYCWRMHAGSVASDISAKPYAWDAAKRAVEAHLSRTGLRGEVVFSKAVPMLHVNYKIAGDPLVSVIIPSKDHAGDLKTCIDSVFLRSSYRHFEIIVAENNSEEPETLAYYETLEKSGRAKVVRFAGGFNFSAVNNYGVTFASGGHYLFLNNDIEVITEDWIEQMLMFTVQKDTGAAGIKLLYPDNTVQHGGIAVGIGGSAANLCPLFPAEHEGYMSRLAVASDMSAVTGACMMVKKEAFLAAGGFDERLAVSFNDVDLCLKIRALGYSVVFNPVATAYHYESKSRGYDTKGEKRARMERERTIFREKWPQYFGAGGDPFYNRNFGKNSVSYDAV